MRPKIFQAVELLRQNDPAALERALALLQETVFSFSMKVCGQREDAEDTMQEVLLKSVPYLPRFSSPQALSVWLYKVAKNRCLMSRRKSKFAPQKELALDELMPDRRELESLAGGNDENPEISTLRGERAQWLRDAILRLPPAYRLVLVLRDMEELSDEEVAKITGMRAGTVRVRLHRARLYLRKELARRDAFQPAPARRRKAPAEAEEKPRRCRELFAALSDYLDEKLDDSMCDKMRAHMGDCRPCQAFLATLEQTIAQCRETPGACPDRGKAEKIRRALLAKFPQEAGPSPRSFTKARSRSSG
jgi:RNA polymerase sigma-70 factor (ECF subfamily)